VSCELFPCVTWLIHTCDVTHSRHSNLHISSCSRYTCTHTPHGQKRTHSSECIFWKIYSPFITDGAVTRHTNAHTHFISPTCTFLLVRNIHGSKYTFTHSHTHTRTLRIPLSLTRNTCTTHPHTPTHVPAHTCIHVLCIVRDSLAWVRDSFTCVVPDSFTCVVRDSFTWSPWLYQHLSVREFISIYHD